MNFSQGPSAWPQVYYVVHTVTTSNIAEVMIGLGQGRMSPHSPDGPRWEIAGGIEWLAALSMSPQAARHLARQLTDSIEVYERRFGKIPEDPTLNAAIHPESTVINLFSQPPEPPPFEPGPFPPAA